VKPASQPQSVTATETADAVTMTAGSTSVTISKFTGYLTGVTCDAVPVSLANGPAPAGGTATLTALTYFGDDTGWVVQAEYTGDLSSVRWRLDRNGWLGMEYRYHRSGSYDYLGVTFDYPESAVRSLTWLGDGPYRVYKNRLRGVTPDVWSKAYNDTATGASGWQYPEFEGYHANTCWAVLGTTEGSITMVAAEENLFLRLFSPANGPDPQTATAPYPPGDVSFLDGIAPIGNKFHAAAALGPQSQPNPAAPAGYHRSIYFKFESAGPR
jgi:hypothetical protein